MSFPCPNKVTCPGSDDPIANLSAEDYDHRYYYSKTYPKGQWQGACCEYLFTSTVSQEDADIKAQNQAQIANAGLCGPVVQADGTTACVDPDVGCADCDPAEPQMYWNEQQCCPGYCDNGSVFYSCVPAHTVVAKSLAEANMIAASLACGMNAAKRFCLDPIEFNCCANKAFSDQIAIAGGTGPFTWTIVDGALPTGLAFSPDNPDGSNMDLTGTPTTAGVSILTLQVLDSAGNSNQTTLTLGVLDVTPSSLPNATLGTPYSQQMTCAGLPTGKTATFAIESGALPTGLTLSTDGLISGTPTAGLPATFEIGVTIA